MNPDQQIWQIWAQNLHRWGLEDWVAALLEAAGPLSVLGAQAVYLGHPLLQGAFSDSYVEALAHMLEEPTQTKAFVSLLREGPHP